MSWLDWLHGKPAITQAKAGPDPHGYGPFICKTEQAPEHDKEAGS